MPSVRPILSCSLNAGMTTSTRTARPPVTRSALCRAHRRRDVASGAPHRQQTLADDVLSRGYPDGEVVGRASTFRRVWAWTKTHLARADGLLAYHASATRVLDRQSAADADLLAAWALVRYRGPRVAAYRQAGRRLGAAILGHELAYP